MHGKLIAEAINKSVSRLTKFWKQTKLYSWRILASSLIQHVQCHFDYGCSARYTGF